MAYVVHRATASEDAKSQCAIDVPRKPVIKGGCVNRLNVLAMSKQQSCHCGNLTWLFTRCYTSYDIQQETWLSCVHVIAG